MNCVVVLPGEFMDASHIRVDGERATRLYREFGLRVGASCPLALFGVGMARGVVTFLAPDRIELTLEDTVRPPPARLDLELIVGYARPQILKRILLNATLVGLSRVHFVRSVRVEKSYLKSTILENERLLVEVVYGLEQAEDACPPEISFEDSLGRFLDGRFSQIRSLRHGAGLNCYFADMEATSGFPSSTGPAADMFLAVGPEGGWVPSERELLLAAGFQAVSFGARVLRVDTAVLYGAAQLALIREQSTRPL